MPECLHIPMPTLTQSQPESIPLSSLVEAKLVRNSLFTKIEFAFDVYTFLCPTSIAAQMWQLFHILPLLIVGDIAPSDQHYKCFMLLQDIACVLC